MEKAMPEINRLVEVYEKNIKMGIQVKNPRISPQFNNVCKYFWLLPDAFYLINKGNYQSGW